MVRQERHVRPRLAWLLLPALVAVIAPVALAGPGPREQALRRQDRALAAKSRSAVLGLYALQSRLERSQGRLATARARVATLRQEQELVSAQLRIARHGVAISQQRLAQRLRILYEHGGVDPLAVVLGARSLEEAVTGLDSLGQVASSDRRVLAQVEGTRARLTQLQRRLAARRAKLDAAVRAAAETTQSLAQAETARQRFVAGLAAKRRLTQHAIARLVQRAKAAQQKAQLLENAPPAPTAGDAAVAADPAPADPPPSTTTTADPAGPPVDGRTLTVVATGYALGGTTATGLPVGWGVAAVDPGLIPLGTRFAVPGYGEAVAADIGGAIRGATIDLWFPSVAEAHAWGRRTVTITLH